MQLATVFIPSTINTSLAASVYHTPFVVLCAFFPTIFHRKPKRVISAILAIASNMDHYYKSNNSTACTTSRYNIADTWIFYPSLCNISPGRPQTFCALLMFRKISSQLLSDRSRVCPKKLNLGKRQFCLQNMNGAQIFLFMLFLCLSHHNY